MSVTIQVRVDEELKVKSDELFRELGTDTTTAMQKAGTVGLSYEVYGLSDNIKSGIDIYNFKYSTTKTSTTSNAHPPTPIRVRSDAHGLSHALENMPPACFLPSLRSGRAFKSYTPIKKVQHQMVLDFFGRGTRT